MKRYLIFSCLQFFPISILVACSMVCGYAYKFNSEKYILEGKVIGYTESYEKEGVKGKVSGLILKTTKTIYAPQKVKKFSLFIFGLSADCRPTGKSISELKKNYKVGTYITFIAYKTGVPGLSGVKFGLPYCSIKFKGKFKDRIPYAYENNRREITKLQNEIDALRKKGSDLFIRDYQKKLKFFKEEINKKQYPVKFQDWLHFLAIHRAKTEEERYRILEELIWSPTYYNPNFIYHHKVNRDYQKKLASKFKKIKKGWPVYY